MPARAERRRPTARILEARMTRRTRLWVLLVLVLPAGGGCLSSSGEVRGPLAALERSLVFPPRPYPDGNWSPADLVHEDAWFEADDGTKLHGWFCPAPQP